MDRVADVSGKQFPCDELTEADYSPIENGTVYMMRFNPDHTVVIGPEGVSGALVEVGGDYIEFSLSDPLFAGGRLRIWLSADGTMQAEYTVYGSGVPFISSERGELIVVVV